MPPTITFEKLYDKLGELGFRQTTIELNGITQYVFEHKTIPNAMIILPERDRNDEVEPFYMVSVLAMLKTHRVVPEYNPLLT